MTLFHRKRLSVMAMLCGSLAMTAAAAEVRKQTYTYKTVGDLAIKADVYTSGEMKKRPVVVWIHGGALINGHRDSVMAWLKDAFLPAGYALVSIDYRLAPETQLPGIIEDVEDSFAWLRQHGPELFDADPERVAVVGGSAGGYLTLICGHRVRPRPNALVSLWGYGDLVGSWYSEPSPHPRHHQLKPTRKEAYKQIAGPAISDARDRKGDGGMFYQYCRQHGAWPQAVSGWNPHTEADKFAPFMPVKNVTSEFPPTLLIHGDADTDVPYQQSVLMADEFKRHGVQHQLIRFAGAEHGLAGADRQAVDDAYRTATEFVRRYLK